MLKRYYIKWYFILTGILTCATTLSLLLRHERFNEVQWWEYLEYGGQISLTLFVCWLIHGFFLIHNDGWLNHRIKHVVSIALASVATFLLAFVLYSVLPLSRLNENNVPYNTVSDVVIHFIGGFLASLISYVVFYSVYTNSALQNSRLTNEILEQAHLRAQLLSLQQQISPHFLFNSLSTLKTLTSEPPTKSFIVQLAAVYRYVLNYNQHYLTPLRDEINFIRSYLYIMTTRYEDSLQVSIKVSEGHQSMLIPPLSLQLLIENAIKHNMVSPEHPLKISITADDQPSLIVANNLQLKKVAEDGTGTGLKNISERYKLLIKKPVEINIAAGYFIVNLPLLQQ